MITPTSLVIYVLLGLTFSMLIVLYNEKFTHIMGWSLLKIKRAQFKHKGEKATPEQIDEYEDHILNEIDKPAPDLIIGIFYLLILILIWPLMGILPFFAFLLDVFYLTD